MGSGKPRGINAIRRLHNKRRMEMWADKDLNKRLSGSKYKNPFMGASHAKGIVVERFGVSARFPNFALRKCCMVQLIKNGKKVAAFVPWDGGLNYISEGDEVVLAGLGKKGRIKSDLPGVKFKVIKVEKYSLLSLYRGKKPI